MVADGQGKQAVTGFGTVVVNYSTNKLGHTTKHNPLHGMAFHFLLASEMRAERISGQMEHVRHCLKGA